MKVNMIGIGKMGYPLVQNMVDHGHEVYAFDVSEDNINRIKEEVGIEATTDFDTFMQNAFSDEKYRIFWLMLPPGEITDNTVKNMLEYIQENDVVIEGGNSNHHNSMKSGELLAEKGAYFMDVGTSGGVSGARNGASFMIGGDKQVYEDIEELFSSLATPEGYVYTGKTGSGHFLKLVHNAIYYGIQQSYGEGLEILEKSEFDYDLAEVTAALNKSSVIRSWVLEIIADAFANDNHLEGYSGHVKGSKSTNWVVNEAMNMDVPVPAIYSALAMRHRGIQDDESFSGKVVSAIRAGVGGYDKK
ncbi:6-phosphogluconate dehydrogenase [Suicoccus acidiformans]|uniref:6-phosphogluconate dehydrogenase n=1 Tax=Suicoccus acidiformans TaxID=2036206 RepID=A0A347WII3_9LACT|nr:NADP-dependent phosphogluconate dehydrogenase [Suicoccus acidiformans]AXY24890.1 6-phosphogluconate dehydrogenase [Suicoccus acidiformans]